MNWEAVALRAEVDYRVERAMGDRVNAEHVRQTSWWQRRRAHHTRHDDETRGTAKAA